MRIACWNVNGLRAVEKRGDLHNLIRAEDPDVLFLQEVKAREDQLSEWALNHNDYWQDYHPAEKPGYSGVGVWVRRNLSVRRPLIARGLRGYNDTEGRVIRCDLGALSLLGIYFPNGGKSEEAWADKLVFYDRFLDYVNFLREAGRQVIWCGDLNVAHNEIDLARPRENEGNVGFRREERDWMDRVTAADWVDVFRTRNPDEVSYTWWNMQTRSRERNIGWRIDLFLVDKALYPLVQDMKHLTEFPGSDHAPIVLDIDASGAGSAKGGN